MGVGGGLQNISPIFIIANRVWFNSYTKPMCLCGFKFMFINIYTFYLLNDLSIYLQGVPINTEKIVINQLGYIKTKVQMFFPQFIFWEFVMHQSS